MPFTPQQTAAFHAFNRLVSRVKKPSMRLEKARALAMDMVARKLGLTTGLLQIELMDEPGCRQVIETCESLPVERRIAS